MSSSTHRWQSSSSTRRARASSPWGAALGLMGRVPADLVGMPLLGLCDEHLPSVGRALRMALTGLTSTLTVEILSAVVSSRMVCT